MIQEANFPGGNLILPNNVVYFKALKQAVYLNRKFSEKRI